MLAALVALALWAAPASAQPWSGIIAPARATDWLANAPGAGPIPTTRTQCGATIAAYTGSAATINSAIAACGANQYVKLGPGTFTISSMIDFGSKDNVTLSGSGPDQTFIKFTSSGAGSCTRPASICVAGDKNWWQGAPGNVQNWTAGYAQGTTTITLAGVSNLAVGHIMVLDQLNDTTDDGAIYNCFVTGSCILQTPDTGRNENNPTTTHRGQHQTVLVTGINGTSVTIAPPIEMPNWRSAKTPQAWYASRAPRVGIGIEDLSVDYTAVGTHALYGIQFAHARHGWIKNVRSLNSNNAHVSLYLTSNITVRDSYFYGTQNAASVSYGIEPWMGHNNLVENNIFQHIAAAILNSSTTGSVYGYNYAIDDYYAVSPDWMQSPLYTHEPSNDYILWEGNDGIGITFDLIHGHARFNTVFRNRLVGWEPGKSNQTVPFHNYAFNRNHNAIGNVLGHPGYHTTYTIQAGASLANCTTSIYVLGLGGNCSRGGTGGDPPDDPRVAATLMRWGNWDSVNNAVRFEASEVPSTLALYRNPVPATQALPPSLYLRARPSWWVTSFGTPAWPPIGPDVTGGNLTDGVGAAASLGGHAYKIPARLCYENLPRVNNILTYNATQCYSSGGSSAGTPPSAPTNPVLR
jgi:hypothetical protein